MILLQSLKKNFNLTDKGFYYFRVRKCMLDIPSLTITISAIRDRELLVDSLLTHIGVRDCSWCQIKLLQ